MLILFDNGIFSHAEFAEISAKQKTVRWGDIDQALTISGLARKRESLFTRGRSLRCWHFQVADKVLGGHLPSIASIGTHGARF